MSDLLKMIMSPAEAGERDKRAWIAVEALELAAKRFEALRDLTDHVPHRIACSTWADEARQALDTLKAGVRDA